MARKKEERCERTMEFFEGLRTRLGCTDEVFASLVNRSERAYQYWKDPAREFGVPNASAVKKQLVANLEHQLLNGTLGLSDSQIKLAIDAVESFETEDVFQELRTTEDLHRRLLLVEATTKLISAQQEGQAAALGRLECLNDRESSTEVTQFLEQQLSISAEHRNSLTDLSDKMEKLCTELNWLSKVDSSIEVAYSHMQTELAGLFQSIEKLSKAQQEVQLYLESYTRRTLEFQCSTETGLAELCEALKEIHNTLDTHSSELHKYSSVLAGLVERVDAFTQYPNWVSNEADWRRVVESKRPTTEDERQQLYNLMKKANRPEEDLRQIVHYGLYSKDEFGGIFIELKGGWVTKLTHDTTLSFGVALGVMLPVWFSKGVPSNSAALLAILTIVSILAVVGGVFQREIVRPYFTAYLWMKGRDRRTGLSGLLDRATLVSTLASLGPRTA